MALIIKRIVTGLFHGHWSLLTTINGGLAGMVRIIFLKRFNNVLELEASFFFDIIKFRERLFTVINGTLKFNCWKEVPTCKISAEITRIQNQPATLKSIKRSKIRIKATS